MLKARISGITILDDYAHHPTEIRASLSAIRQRYNPKRLWCVFQPHQYSRTRFLLDDFAKSFTLADITIVPEIYFVRDTAESKSTVNAEALVRQIKNNGSEALFINDFAGILEHLKNNVKPGDMVVTMGAGTIWKVADEYIHWLGSNS
jgi:UDP-N-acetylmuramate--alanine ligase